jgi:hypothetical protein
MYHLKLGAQEKCETPRKYFEIRLRERFCDAFFNYPLRPCTATSVPSFAYLEFENAPVNDTLHGNFKKSTFIYIDPAFCETTSDRNTRQSYISMTSDSIVLAFAI